MTSFDSPTDYAPISNRQGYLIGTNGVVLSNKGRCKWPDPSRPYVALVPHVVKNRLGTVIHTRVTFYPGPVYCLVSHLVLTAFVGPRPEGKECCHWDGNPLNNSLENLRWDTHKSNMRDNIRIGTLPVGESSPLAILNTNQVLEIRARYAIGDVTLMGLADEYHVSFTTIQAIVSRRSWKHI